MIRQLFLVIFSLGLLTSCTSVSEVNDAEQEGANETNAISPNYYSYESVAELAVAASNIANGYLQVADKNSARQDRAAVGLFATAALGAYGAVSGASAAELAKVGLAGLTIGQANRYYSPQETNKRLFNAAERQMCIVSAARIYSTQSNSSTSYGLIADALTQNRILLRRELSRDLPDYSKLVSEYGEALDEESRSQPRNMTRNKTASEQSNDILRVQVKGCLVKTGNS